MRTTGVLLTGFGGPDSLDAVGPFMCNLMGTEPSEELVQRVCGRYLAIGGSSPLTEIAVGIAGKLKASLAGMGHDLPVEVGMRYWEPYIGDALGRLHALGCDRVITVSLSPFESKVAHGAYREAINQAALDLGGLEIVEAPLVSSLDEFAHFFALSTAGAIMDLEPNEGGIVVFTAHSLPESDLTDDDPYVVGLESVAQAVAAELGMTEGRHGAGMPMFDDFQAFGSVEPPRAWFLAYQSKGNRPGAWLGPEIDELIDAAAQTAVSGLIVVPIGFLTDHMETLYDLDIVAAGRALDVDLEFVRAQVPNDDDEVVAGMARSIAQLI